MTHELIDNENGTITITVNFEDEGVEINGKTTVKGNTETAERYLTVFEADLRRNYAEVFPPPPEPEPIPGEMM